VKSLFSHKKSSFTARITNYSTKSGHFYFALKQSQFLNDIKFKRLNSQSIYLIFLIRRKLNIMVPMNPSINRNSEKLFEDLRREMLSRKYRYTLLSGIALETLINYWGNISRRSGYFRARIKKSI